MDPARNRESSVDADGTPILSGSSTSGTEAVPGLKGLPAGVGLELSEACEPDAMPGGNFEGTVPALARCVFELCICCL